MNKSIILASVFIALTGCASQPNNEKFNVHTADFTKSSDLNLCAVYGARANRSIEAKNELVKRGVFSDAEWESIANNKVSVGMTECAVKAAYSVNFIKQKSTKFKNGDKGMTFFYDCKSSNATYCPFTKVDFVNGKVSAVSKVQKI